MFLVVFFFLLSLPINARLCSGVKVRVGNLGASVATKMGVGALKDLGDTSGNGRGTIIFVLVLRW